MAEGLNSACAEELGDAETTDLLVVIVVRGEGDVDAAVGKQGACHELRAGAEDEVLGFEDFGSGGFGGDDDGWDLAQLEVHERAVLGGEVSERDVGESAEFQEVSDDGERPGAGWKVVASSSPVSAISC